ncbi:MAG: 5-oxoprolinase subunit PxpA [Pseudomonadota bacterium]
MNMHIDLNADIGEGCGDDAGILKVVTSCNIACGGHAGDETSMQEALLLARQSGAIAGAHPSYPDRENFGRKPMEMPKPDLLQSLCMQITAIRDIASYSDVPLTHVKPHGALYNAAAADADLATVVVDAVLKSLPGATLVGPPNSSLSRAAQEQGLRFIAEGFADRAYEKTGALRDRRLEGAIIETEDARARQAEMIAVDRRAPAHGGGAIHLPAETICLHGDSPGALASARAIRERLAGVGVALRAHT